MSVKSENNGTAFLESEQLKKLGVANLIASLDVRSHYGEEARRGLKPFLPGNETEFTEHFRILRRVGDWLKANESGLPALLSYLSRIENIDGYLSARSWNQTTIFVVKKCLKNFVAAHKIFSENPEPIADLVPKLAFEEIAALNRFPFNENDFALPDEFTPKLKKLRKSAKEIRLKLEKSRKEQLDNLRKRLKLPKNCGTEFIVDRTDSSLLKKVSADNEVVPIRELSACVHFRLRESVESQSLAEELSTALRKQRSEEQKIYRKLGAEIEKKEPKIRAALEKLGKLDLLIAISRFAQETKACIPQLSIDSVNISNGNFLPLKNILAKSGEDYSSLNISIAPPGAIITGSNMGGKTTVLFSVGFLQALAQFGIPPPAESFSAPLFSHIFLSVTDELDFEKGLSAFGREIGFFKNALPFAKNRSLYLIDEPGRATNIVEGRALSLAMLEKIIKDGSTTLVTTHDEKLASRLNLRRYRMAGLKPDADAGGLCGSASEARKLMDYRILPEDKTKSGSDAIRVAELLGLDKELINRALFLQEIEFCAKDE
ncbi:MAG: endonuclease MutS2 [Myxococcota bacterium]